MLVELVVTSQDEIWLRLEELARGRETPAGDGRLNRQIAEQRKVALRKRSL